MKIKLPEFAAIVSGVTKNTIPEEKIFAESALAAKLGPGPWDMEPFTGPEANSSALVRLEILTPADGWYSFDCAADWSLTVYLDGVRIGSLVGKTPDNENKARLYAELKAGKHNLELNFTRGSSSALLSVEVSLCDGKPDFGVDLTTAGGPVKRALHGSNTTLLLASRKLRRYDEELHKLNFTLSRTHDWALWNSGQRIVDTHFIFPLQHLDPKDPVNYFFDATDEILRLTIEEAKMEPFFRLGTSIEHTGIPQFNTVPPKDHEKYAEVLAGIVRHYTQGWANGYHYNIRYWEIWNEPDGGDNMWNAPYETFIPFFVTVLKRLKREFPDLRFGGPALCSLNKRFMNPLLDACKQAGIAPDFFSWHCYGCDPDRLIDDAYRGRKMLDDAGFTKTEICINEWHYVESWSGVQHFDTPEEYQAAHEVLNGINSAAYNVAVFSGWQYGPLDAAMWYGSSWDWDSWGYEDHLKHLTKNYYSMELPGRFIGEFTQKCRVQNFNSIFLLAGKNAKGDKAGLLVSDFKGGNTELRIPVKGIEKYQKVSAVILDASRNLEAVKVDVVNGELVLKKAAPGSTVFYVTME